MTRHRVTALLKPSFYNLAAKVTVATDGKRYLRRGYTYEGNRFLYLCLRWRNKRGAISLETF
jgi:hypothetical protein